MDHQAPILIAEDDETEITILRMAAQKAGLVRKLVFVRDGADVLAYLPEDLLVKMDRASMANSLEARAPLLDHRLMEFVASLPSKRKVTMRRTKVLLREIATELLTKELVERPKMGFGVPLGEWFMGGLGNVFQETVLAPDSRSRDYFDVMVAEDLFREHRAGAGQHSHRLWLFLMFELWARRWLGDQAVAA